MVGCVLYIVYSMVLGRADVVWYPSDRVWFGEGIGDAVRMCDNDDLSVTEVDWLDELWLLLSEVEFGEEEYASGTVAEADHPSS